MTTRIGFGKTRVLRVETDTDMPAQFPNGVIATYHQEQTDGPYILLSPAPAGRGKKCKFHQYPDGTHHVSLPLMNDNNSLKPFRIGVTPVIEDEGGEHHDWSRAEEGVKIPLPYVRQTPHRGEGYTRRDKGRQSHPLSVLESLDLGTFSTVVFNQLAAALNSYAADHSVRLCLDDQGQVYGRLG